jgi:ABC-type glutathione transport system ATPase component
VPQIDHALRRLRLPACTIDELTQRLRFDLLFGDGAPKIADYAGHCDQAGRLRVTATLRALSQHRREGRSREPALHDRVGTHKSSRDRLARRVEIGTLHAPLLDGPVDEVRRFHESSLTLSDLSSQDRLAASDPRHGRATMIHANDLTKRYRSTTAVDHLSVTVHPGRVTGFLGPNGAGKSTTMRMILGLDRPTSGSVTVNGMPYRDLPSPLRSVGALLDPKAVDPKRSAAGHLTVAPAR